MNNQDGPSGRGRGMDTNSCTLKPIYVAFPADRDQGDMVLRHLPENKPAFVFERCDPITRAPLFTYIGVNVTPSLYAYDALGQAAQDPVASLHAHLGQYVVEACEELPPFQGGVLAFLAYDAARYFEPRLERAIPPSRFPAMGFLEVRTLFAIDHVRGLGFLIQLVDAGDTLAQDRTRQRLARMRTAWPQGACWTDTAEYRWAGAWTHDVSRNEFCRRVDKIKDYIGRGDILQAVLSMRMRKVLHAHPYRVYQELRSTNPSPHIFFVRFPTFSILGSSPLMFLRVHDRAVIAEADAGTRAIPTNGRMVGRVEKELLASEKDRAEHLMLVDLARNDLGRIARIGSVTVPTLMQVRKFSHVMHIFSEVHAELGMDHTSLDAVRACFPAGPVAGAPKIRAIEILAELEGGGRDLYGGTIGLFGYDGSVDTAVLIRSLWIVHNEVSLQVGAGIVADSDPADEYEECVNKAAAIIHSVERAETVGTA